MRYILVGAGVAAALTLAGCAGSSFAPKWQHAGIRHHHHAVHSVWRTATIHKSRTNEGGSNEGGSTGLASFYHGSKTASGESFAAESLTAAHRSLPFGTHVRVTNLTNHRSVTVRINDRGPFVHNRSIDLSDGAAAAIGMTGAGVTRVRMEVMH